ncbi:MAG TPA: 2'-deoxycytidine 5'-triphosphate deaminase, partial [Methylomirabilota bacterium]|nr:2'-deoxycytidine 5'-triphosphate deaminase [Methylomirabilota bacterium]
MTASGGVLTDRDLRAAVREGAVRAAEPFRDDQFQPASLDLRLGRVAYQLRASFLPYRETVQRRLEDERANSDLVIDRVPLEGG